MDVAHAMDTGDTVTDGQDATGLSKASFFLHTTDSLFEDGRHFRRGGFGIGSVRSDLFRGRIERRRGDDPGLDEA